MSPLPNLLNQNPSNQNNAQPNIKMLLDGLFNPIVRVIPAHDWSKIQAIWIPLLHHDYLNKLARSERITLLQTHSDKFGTIQGYLTAPNENYIPYLTTFFNPTWTQEFVTEQILQAYYNTVETIQIVIDDDSAELILKKKILGKTELGMFITITLNEKEDIIDASPIFYKE